MPRFQNDEVAFDVPADWTDESRVMFVFPEAQANVSLTKRAVDLAIPLHEYVTALVRQMAALLPELRVIARGDVLVGSERGAHVTVEWNGPNGRQRSVCRLVVCGEELWSFTASTPVDKLPQTMMAIDRAVASFATVPAHDKA